MSDTDPVLLSLAVVEAPCPVAQAEVSGRIGELFGGARFDVDQHVSIFANAGVERRTFALPLDAYFGALSAANRNAHYLGIARSLLSEAAASVVPERLRQRVTHVVCVSSTGVATPSLECGVIEDVGLSRAARRVPVFGLGCAGGVAGLALARDLARSRPDALVLLLCVELTSLTLLRQDTTLRNFVACALFGDGAAAALVGAPGTGPALASLGEGRAVQFPDSADLMGWDVRAEGWGVIFSPRIPDVVATHIGGLVGEVLDGERPRHYLLHPGGRRILEAYRASLELSEDELAPSTEILARHGNMSAVTAFFVLDHALRSPHLEPGPGLMTAFGPGFTAEVLRVAIAGNGAAGNGAAGNGAE